MGQKVITNNNNNLIIIMKPPEQSKRAADLAAENRKGRLAGLRSFSSR